MTNQNPDNDSLILIEMRAFRRDLGEVQVDVKELKASFMGGAEHAGVYERIRQVESNQRGIIMRYGSFFGLVGAMIGGAIQWLMNGQHPK